MPEPNPGKESQADLTELVASAQSAFRNGALAQAEEICGVALQRAPSDPIANMIMGNVHARKGDLAQAEPFFRKVLESEPGAYEPSEWIAIILRETGRLDEATEASQKLIAMRPNAPGAYMALGLCHLKAQRPNEALPLFAKAVEHQPRSALYHRNLAVALNQVGNPKEALREFKLALSLAPDSAQSYLALADFLSDQKRGSESVPYLEKAAKIEPGCLVFTHLANALEEAGRHDEAMDFTQKAIGAEPKSADALESLGIRFLHLGRFADARESFAQALKMDPERARCYFTMTRAGKVTESDRPLIAKMEALVADSQRGDEDLRRLHYAIAKSYDDFGEYEKAIGHYDMANELAKRVQLIRRPYSSAAANHFREQTIRTFSRKLFDSNREIGSPSELPIFIVGMIRSGTTLVEQIVSSHPDVGAAGELTFWTGQTATEAAAAIMEGRIDSGRLNELAEEYLNILRQYGDGKARVTDKMPLNYHSAGVMHLLFPNARFIHCRRKPLDTCWSIFTTGYTGAPDFFYDRENIVDGYRHYERLMDHWRETLPADRFYELNYESLVKDPAAILPDLTRFLGLPWSEAMLHHQSNERSIQTPSSWQARQPIYTSSVERWRNYEPWLGALRKLLDE